LWLTQEFDAVVLTSKEAYLGDHTEHLSGVDSIVTLIAKADAVRHRASLPEGFPAYSEFQKREVRPFMMAEHVGAQQAERVHALCKSRGVRLFKRSGSSILQVASKLVRRFV
jgi:hypothetical protein